MLGGITVITFAAHGAVGDGIANDTQAIFDAILEASEIAKTYPNRRVVVFGSDGTYKINDTLELSSNVTVLCSPGCVFLADRSAAFDRVSFSGVTDATWIGGTFLRASDGLGGNILKIGSMKDPTTGVVTRSARITIKDVTVRGWLPAGGDPVTDFIHGWVSGVAIAVVGDDIRIYNPTLTDPVIAAGGMIAEGIRVGGGRGFLCMGGYVEGGDDPISFIPQAVRDGDTDGDSSITDGAFIGMVVKGFGSRIVNFALSADSTTSGQWQHNAADTVIYQTSSIRRCRMVDIVAQSTGGRCVQIHNGASSGVIEDIEITNVSVTCGSMSDNPVSIVNDAGGIRRVRLRDVTVRLDAATTIDQEVVRVVRVDDFTWDGGRIDAPATAGSAPTVSLKGVVGGALRNLSIGCRSAIGVQLSAAAPPATNDFGLATRPCRDFVIAGCVVENVRNAGTGIDFFEAENCGVRDSRFTPGLDATAAGLPTGITVHDLEVQDPAAGDAAASVTYTVTLTAKSTSPKVPQSYVVTRTSDGAKMGQGFVDQRFSARGLGFRVASTNPSGTGTFTITVAPISAAAAVSLAAAPSAKSCFVEGCDLGPLTVTVAAGADHRTAALYPATAANRYVGGLLTRANSWTAAQTFSVGFTGMIGFQQSSPPAIGTITIGGVGYPNAINATGSHLLVTGNTSPATNLDSIFYPANSLTGRSGDIIVVRNNNVTNKIVLNDGVGNLSLHGPCTLDQVGDTITLIRGASNKWFELARNEN